MPALRTSPGISHWDDVKSSRGERGHIAGTWQSLTGRASQTVGVKRIQVDPGMWATPLHLEGAEEEIFYVLGGSGVSVQSEGEDAEGYAVRPGDCIVHLALENAHTLSGGEEGVDVLAFGQRSYAGGVTWIPAGRRRVARRDLGARRRRGGPPLDARSGCRSARDRRALDASRQHRQRRGRRAGRAGYRDGRAAGSRPRTRGRVAAHRPPPCRSAARQAECTSALPLGRRGDLRRPRRRRPSAPLGGGGRGGTRREALAPSSLGRPEPAWPMPSVRATTA